MRPTPPSPTLLCISFIEPHFPSLVKKVQGSSSLADWIEIRIDKMSHLTLDELSHLNRIAPSPVLFSLRTHSQGGADRRSLQERHSFFKRLLQKVQPDYCDIEGDVPPAMLFELQKLSPKTKWIASWHVHPTATVHLEQIYKTLTALPVSFYKIATFAKSTLDALRMLIFTRDANRLSPKLCGLCMGEYGVPSRILSPIAASPFTFASFEEGQEAAPGQLSARQLLDVFRFRELHKGSQIYGLIGNPVDKSYSHLTHNAALKVLGKDAVYVKFPLEKEELADFFHLIDKLPVCGLSVTMPFKEKVLSILHQGDCTPCNTLKRTSSGWSALNTDGIGALKIYDSLSKGDKLLIIGAGGTAKAIAEAAAAKGIEVALINRTKSRAEAIARAINGSSGSLEDFCYFVKKGFRSVIQATRVGMSPQIDEMPISQEAIDTPLVALDVISNPSTTLFLKEVKKKGGVAICGTELFIAQAVEQFVFWFSSPHLRDKIEASMRHQMALSAETYRVKKGSLSGSVRLPSSKSHTIRAILLAAMAEGRSIIRFPLDSPDADRAIEAAASFGASVIKKGDELQITGVAGKPKVNGQVIDCGNSGQVLRFGAALASLGKGSVTVTGDESIRSNRPVQALIEGLNQLGAKAISEEGNGYAPLTIQGGFRGGDAAIEGSDSQPVSALLMAAAFAEGTTRLRVAQPGEKPWIALTLSWLDRLGVHYTQKEYALFEVEGNPKRKAFDISVPGDLSSLAFMVAAALVTSSEITIEGVDLDDVQGDKEVIYLLQEMGAQFRIDRKGKKLTVLKNSSLQGRVIDVNPFIDAVPILAVLALFAKGQTHLVNGAIARKKECDRLSCMAKEIKKMGGVIEETADGLTISPSRLIGTTVDSHSDHRVALSLIVAGLAAEGETVIRGIACIKKSYPHFLDDLHRLIDGAMKVAQ